MRLKTLFSRRGILRYRMHKCTNVESCTTNHDRQTPARRGFKRGSLGLPRPGVSGVSHRRLDKIETSVRDSRPICRRRLGSAQIEATIDLTRIGAHYQDVELLGQRPCQTCLPGRRRPADDETWLKYSLR
jgi:hypothetical protein